MTYDANGKDMALTLSEMQRQALNKCNGNQIQATEYVRQWVQQDRRFDQYNAEALVSRAEQCRTSGAVMNLEDDPSLLRERPANRYGSGRTAR
jgi:hypothetical protein